MNPNPPLKAACVFACLLATASCKKNGPSTSSNSPSTYLSSVHIASVGSQLVDSLRYDPDHHLLLFAQYDFDTTSGTPESDSIVTTFSYAAGSGVPNGYTNTFSTSSDPHQLSYDAQNRIIKDTSLNGSGYVAFYTYPNGNTSSNVLFDGTALNNQIDTLFLSGGNIVAFHIYYPNYGQTADSLSGSVQFTYSAYANPAYHADLAGSIGPLLYNLSLDGYGGYEDFLSKDVFQSISATASGSVPGYSLTLNANRDASGRVVQLFSPSLPVSTYNVRFFYY
jgi:hypothetical protein